MEGMKYWKAQVLSKFNIESKSTAWKSGGLTDYSLGRCQGPTLGIRHHDLKTTRVGLVGNLTCKALMSKQKRKQFASANKSNRYHYLNKIYITAQHKCIARIVYFIYLFIDYIAVIGKLGNFLI